MSESLSVILSVCVFFRVHARVGVIVRIHFRGSVSVPEKSAGSHHVHGSAPKLIDAARICSTF
jgi:hypothetical protein